MSNCVQICYSALCTRENVLCVSQSQHSRSLILKLFRLIYSFAGEYEYTHCSVVYTGYVQSKTSRLAFANRKAHMEYTGKNTSSDKVTDLLKKRFPVCCVDLAFVVSLCACSVASMWSGRFKAPTTKRKSTCSSRTQCSPYKRWSFPTRPTTINSHIGFTSQPPQTTCLNLKTCH